MKGKAKAQLEQRIKQFKEAKEMTPQEVLDEAKEELEKVAKGIVVLESGDEWWNNSAVDITLFNLKEGIGMEKLKFLFISTIKAFIEAEIAMLEGMKFETISFEEKLANHKAFGASLVGSESDHIETGYNEAIDDQITHFKELKIKI